MTEDTAKLDTEKAQRAVADELQGRVEEFNKELIPLLGKYELGLGASAFINPNGTIGARPIMFDARNKQAKATPAEPGAVEAPAVQVPSGGLSEA